MVLTYVNRNQIASLGRKTRSNGTLNDGTKVRAQKKKEKKDYNATRQGKKRKIDRIDISGKEHFFTIRSFPISHRLARFPFHTRNNHINIGTPPHSCRDHPPFFLDNTIYSRGKRKGIEVSKPLLLFPFLSLSLSSPNELSKPLLSISPFFPRLHLFLIRYSVLLNEKPRRSLPPSLPSFLPDALSCIFFCFALLATHEDIFPPPLPSTPTSFLERAPLVRDIILFRVSNFKRYYSPFREPPSANLRSFSSSISG